MSPLSFFFFLVAVPAAMSDGSSSCSTTEMEVIAKAFNATKGLKLSDLYNSTVCTANKTEIHLPSRNITGTISWMSLHNVSNLRVIDLSRNLIYGSIPTSFWVSNAIRHLNLASNRLGGVIRFSPARGQRSSLRKLDLSDNRLTNCVNVSGFAGLRLLDLSGNRLRNLPVGVERLDKLERLDLSRCNISGDVKPALSGVAASLRYLDLSRNKMTGVFHKGFPAMGGLVFLNISFNHFSGFVEVEQYMKFGSSAFVSSGLVLRPAASNSVGTSSSRFNTTLPTHKPSQGHKKKTKMMKKETTGTTAKRKKSTFFSRIGILCLSIGGAAVGIAGMVFVWCCICNKKKTEKKRIQWIKTASRFDTEAAWVAESGSTSTGNISQVIMFEKPLMNLTFSDLVAATSGFGKESQLAEGKASGRPVYRAILPGDIDVAIKVLEKAREVEGVEAKSTFYELAGIKHPNVLPLLGYCIAGKEKLLLYEYMKNGDLHRWLHELPMLERGGDSAMEEEEEDWNISDNTYTETSGPRTESGSWPTRYRIALGIARGLAFLHHAARNTPIVHGRVVSSNVLLNKDLVPAITWTRINGNDADGGVAMSTESDVYGFGVVLMELMTGRVGSETTVKSFRNLVRDGTGLADLDPRIRIGSALEEKEMMESQRVAYMCTAEVVRKRPSMSQVVGLLKDIRPLFV